MTKQRESFFAGATIRDPAVDASFNAQITRLKNLLRPALILENAAPGELSHAAANSGGLLVPHGDHSFARLLNAASKGTRDLAPGTTVPWFSLALSLRVPGATFS